ncbi:hypothetical protein PAAG_04213 [Paracoccidioides lutzii Pb01]|uniref:Uncharacterized protein n=1 Tax=Paracoccidioides lutzii (strain ATCC MYA-826 / Pb01) TaxID=502779 RepID=C1H0B9_PARBA|nr:hypothetical protein PAAG_04213 [Paracoccidioides lutzii Pb01]EEH33160.2 hypothetical protein PAAG_04213 [Paracoccidioides lutzii Pb01]
MENPTTIISEWSGSPAPRKIAARSVPISRGQQRHPEEYNLAGKQRICSGFQHKAQLLLLLVEKSSLSEFYHFATRTDHIMSCRFLEIPSELRLQIYAHICYPISSFPPSFLTRQPSGRMEQEPRPRSFEPAIRYIMRQSPSSIKLRSIRGSHVTPCSFSIAGYTYNCADHLPTIPERHGVHINADYRMNHVLMEGILSQG